MREGVSGEGLARAPWSEDIRIETKWHKGVVEGPMEEAGGQGSWSKGKEGWEQMEGGAGLDLGGF